MNVTKVKLNPNQVLEGNKVFKCNGNELVTGKKHNYCNKFIFKFNDGEEVVCDNVHSLQEFIDKMNKTHVLEKQLKLAKECLENYKSGTTDSWFAKATLEQIDELEELNKISAVETVKKIEELMR